MPPGPRPAAALARVDAPRQGPGTGLTITRHRVAAPSAPVRGTRPATPAPRPMVSQSDGPHTAAPPARRRRGTVTRRRQIPPSPWYGRMTAGRMVAAAPRYGRARAAHRLVISNTRGSDHSWRTSTPDRHRSSPASPARIRTPHLPGGQPAAPDTAIRRAAAPGEPGYGYPPAAPLRSRSRRPVTLPGRAPRRRPRPARPRRRFPGRPGGYPPQQPRAEPECRCRSAISR